MSLVHVHVQDCPYVASRLIYVESSSGQMFANGISSGMVFFAFFNLLNVYLRIHCPHCHICLTGPVAAVQQFHQQWLSSSVLVSDFFNKYLPPY